MHTKRFHRLKTCHGTTVAVRRQDGLIIHVVDFREQEHLAGAFLFIPVESKGVAFLLFDLPPIQRVSMGSPEPIDPVLSLRVSYAADATTVIMSSPTTGLFLTASPPVGEPGSGGMFIAASLPQLWEQFCLEASEASVVPDAIVAAGDVIERLCPKGPCPVRLIEQLSLEPTPFTAPAVTAVARLLSREQWPTLVEGYINSDKVVDVNLAKFFPDDIYATIAVPLIRAKLASRPAQPARDKTPTVEVPVSLDELDTVGIDGRFTSFPYTLNVALRASAKPRRRACVLATARNEGLYLLEWVAYHQIIGFEKLIVYTNDNSDGSDALLQALHDSGQILLIRNIVGQGRRAQWKAYGHALRIAPEILDYEWTLAIDLDEFFLPDPQAFSSVTEFLDWHLCRDVDALAMNWLLIGSNGQVRWNDKPLSERFRTGQMSLQGAVKTLFRSNRAVHSFPHHAIPYHLDHFTRLTAGGQPHLYDQNLSPAASRVPSAEGATIVHFFCKSNEEFLWKAARNRGDHPLNKLDSLPGLDRDLLLDFMSRSAMGKTSIPIAVWTDQVLKRMALLRSLPDVEVSLELIKRQFQEESPKLLSSLKKHPVIASMPEQANRFVDDLDLAYELTL